MKRRSLPGWALLIALTLAACGADNASGDTISREQLIARLTAHDFTESVANCAADAQPAFPLDASDAAISLDVITDLTTCGGVEPTMSACVASAMSDALGGLPSLDDMLAGAGRMTTDVKRKYLEGVVVCKGLDPTVAHCILTSLQPGLVDAALAPGPNPQQLIDRFAELKAACS